MASTGNLLLGIKLAKSSIRREKQRQDGKLPMMIYYKKERDYFKWVFALIVFMLGLMLTWSEAGGETLLQ